MPKACRSLPPPAEAYPMGCPGLAGGGSPEKGGQNGTLANGTPAIIFLMGNGPGQCEGVFVFSGGLSHLFWNHPSGALYGVLRASSVFYFILHTVRSTSFLSFFYFIFISTCSHRLSSVSSPRPSKPIQWLPAFDMPCGLPSTNRRSVPKLVH